MSPGSCYGELKERYEVLRSQSLGYLPGRAERELFKYRGMAAWIKAWRNYTPPGDNPTTGGSIAEHTSQTWEDIVMILASMLTACGRGKDRDERRAFKGEGRALRKRRLPLRAPVNHETGVREYREHEKAICASAARCGAGLAS
ncbi:hypothetical protein SBDP1_1170032 [Syntrophobacter sp. SbD1]|nr:hypothetical protein SBDP1_1170032 [Syntrophobacter sp. SbD1]